MKEYSPLCRIPTPVFKQIKNIQLEFKCSFPIAFKIWQKKIDKNWVTIK